MDQLPFDRAPPTTSVKIIGGMSAAPRTVLVVDDDPQVLRLVEKMLRPRNVKVLVAPRPTEALAISENEPVHLLISDLAMPEMDGRKLVDRVLQMHPGAAVLLISGRYAEPPPSAKKGHVRFLRKPFFPSDLVEHLKELLPEA
jgi:two-component system, cell cycle sensor histidine kinase and response regulator CckA